MLDKLLEVIAEALPDLLDSGDGLDGALDGGTAPGDGTPGEAIAGTKALAESSVAGANAAGTEFDGVSRYLSSIEPAPPSSTSLWVDTVMGNLNEDLAAIGEMSPEELEAYTSALDAKSAVVDTQMQVQGIESNIRSDVAESTRKLGEDRAKSFGSGIFTPSENGLTLSDVNVPVGEHELTDLGNGVYERDGSHYRRLLNGTYDRIE